MINLCKIELYDLKLHTTHLVYCFIMGCVVIRYITNLKLCGACRFQRLLNWVFIMILGFLWTYLVGK